MTGRDNEHAPGSRRRARQLRAKVGRLLAGGAAVAVVSATVAVTVPGAGPAATGAARSYGADIDLAGVTLGVGGTGDGFSFAVPFYFYGTAIPQGDRFQPIVYPASYPLPNIPIISSLPVLSDLPFWPQSLAQSSDKGAANLQQHLDAVPAGEKVTILGLSQGALVAEMVRASMAADPKYTENAEDYEFVLVGNPTRPDGGLLTRFAFLKDVPVLEFLGIPFGRPGPVDSEFKTTDIANQYDGISDFPRYFNPLAVVNAVAGMVVQHVIPGYLLDDPNNPNRVETTVGNTTYVTLPQHLPLLFPLRAPASLIGAERFVDFMEPVLRVVVEMGYDRTADPSKVAPFSLVTPQAKIDEAKAQLPGAIAESIDILKGKPYTPTVPKPVVSPQQDPPVTTVDADQVTAAARIADDDRASTAPVGTAEEAEEYGEAQAAETTKRRLIPGINTSRPRSLRSLKPGKSLLDRLSPSGRAVDPRNVGATPKDAAKAEEGGKGGHSDPTRQSAAGSSSPSGAAQERHEKPRTKRSERRAQQHSEPGAKKSAA